MFPKEIHKVPWGAALMPSSLADDISSSSIDFYTQFLALDTQFWKHLIIYQIHEPISLNYKHNPFFNLSTQFSV